MEVRIGVQNVAREITFETTQSSDEIFAAVKASLGSEALEPDRRQGRSHHGPVRFDRLRDDGCRAQVRRRFRRSLNASEEHDPLAVPVPATASAE